MITKYLLNGSILPQTEKAILEPRASRGNVIRSALSFHLHHLVHLLSELTPVVVVLVVGMESKRVVESLYLDEDWHVKEVLSVPRGKRREQLQARALGRDANLYASAVLWRRCTE